MTTFPFFPILLSTFFFNSSQEQEGNHFPAPFLFVSFFFLLLFRTGLVLNLLGLLCYIYHFYLMQLMCESRLFISIRKGISLYNILNQLLCWPYGFFSLPSRHMRNIFPKVLIIIICHIIEARDLKHPYGLGSCTLNTYEKDHKR